MERAKDPLKQQDRPATGREDEPGTRRPENRTQGPSSLERRPSHAGKLIGGAALIGIALLLLAWAVWGFRWPPTAEVVVDPGASDAVRSEPSDSTPAGRTMP